METVTYRLIEKESRVYAVDENDVEIVGARQPYGMVNWEIYPTVRITSKLHRVIATTRDAAVEHVRMIAELWSKGIK